MEDKSGPELDDAVFRADPAIVVVADDTIIHGDRPNTFASDDAPHVGVNE